VSLVTKKGRRQEAERFYVYFDALSSCLLVTEKEQAFEAPPNSSIGWFPIGSIKAFCPLPSLQSY
jgi:hypothetical protein